MNRTSSEAIAEAYRDSASAITASLILYCGDFDLAEDAVQEAFELAAGHWHEHGVPPNPAGWITTTAKRRLIDRFRREQRRDEKESAVARLAEMPDDPSELDDHRLRLIFTCCHPALPRDVQVALTMRTVCGLSTRQIADAFVVSESTMSQRLVRGKRKIKMAGIPYEIPPPEELGNRLNAVLAVAYLAFNAGYDATLEPAGGEVHLCDEAIQLVQLLSALMPNEPEILGLLGLMMLHHARFAARLDAAGEMVKLDDQDRSLWDRATIEEALRVTTAAAGKGSVGQYWIQAAIAAEHIAPRNSIEPDWASIVGLYDQLVALTNGSEVVQLNRAIAVTRAFGATAGLEALSSLGARLDGYSYFHAAVADCHERTGRSDEALQAYQRAINTAETEAQRRSLRTAQEKLEEIS